MSEALARASRYVGDAVVLIVEDEALVALYLKDTLDELGYRCCGVARTAEQAIVAAAAQRPAVALVDIGLGGGGDGITLARDLFERFGLPVIFLSGTNDARTLERARAASPRAFLAKPCTEHEIAAALGTVLVPLSPD